MVALVTLKWRLWLTAYRLVSLISSRVLSRFSGRIFRVLLIVNKSVPNGIPIMCRVTAEFEVPPKKGDYGIYGSEFVHKFLFDRTREKEHIPYSVRMFVPVKCERVSIRVEAASRITANHREGFLEYENVKPGWQDVTIFLNNKEKNDGAKNA